MFEKVVGSAVAANTKQAPTRLLKPGNLSKTVTRTRNKKGLTKGVQHLFSTRDGKQVCLMEGQRNPLWDGLRCTLSAPYGKDPVANRDEIVHQTIRPLVLRATDPD